MTILSAAEVRRTKALINAKGQALRSQPERIKRQIRAEIRLLKERLARHDKAMRAVVAKREQAKAEATRRIEQAIRSAGPGCVIETGLYGPVRVVRINQRTVTIETSSGHRERIPYDRIVGVET